MSRSWAQFDPGAIFLEYAPSPEGIQNEPAPAQLLSSHPRRTTHFPWCPLKLNVSVPATLFATQTCLTSCGSAVAGLSSIMFSSRLANTVPFASLARHVGLSDGNTKTIGPTTSGEASAVTQLSSSASSSFWGAGPERSLEEDSPNFSSISTRFRFLTFLSPLNVNGLGMVRGCSSVIACRSRKLTWCC